jgi:Family of unknown function (DUF5677)
MSFSPMKPTKKILLSCDAIYGLVDHFHRENGSTPVNRRFEANMDAANSIRHLINLISSMVSLARQDVAYVASANLIARAIIETSCKTLWILNPLDPFEREWRWTLYLDTAIDHYERLSDMKYLPENSRATFKRQRSSYAKFSCELKNLIKDEGPDTSLQKYPSMNQMVRQLDKPEFYYFYSLLSAYTHTNFVVIQHYCNGLGAAKEQGVFFEPSDWILPLSVAAGCFFSTATKILRERDIMEHKYLTMDSYNECLRTIRSIV